MNRQPVWYFQTDGRWRSKPYRTAGENSTIGSSGCGPTCAAMVIETLTGQTYTPEDACNWSMDHGYKALNQGTYYSYFTPQLGAFGIDCRQLNSASLYGDGANQLHDVALSMLQYGWYIIACMGRGTWTSSGHFVLVWWEDGAVHINDPASTSASRVKGDLDTFRSQVKYYWAVDARTFNGPEETETEEEETVTQEQFNEMMEAYLTAKGRENADSWAQGELAGAIADGITDGSRPQGLVTRQEAAIMAERAFTAIRNMVDSMGKG